MSRAILQSLDGALPTTLRTAYGAQFEQLATHQLATDPSLDSHIALLLHRITVSEHRVPVPDPLPPRLRPRDTLPLELHYLLTVWSGSAEAEQTLMTWALRFVCDNPVLDTSLLATNAGFDPEDRVHVVLAEMTTEDLLRIWDGFAPTYRLCHPLIARIVCVDSGLAADGRPVVASQFHVDNRRPGS